MAVGSMKARITKRAVDAIPVPSAEVGEMRLWDIEMRGFFVRVYPSGRRVYALKYRHGRTQRILTIGVHGSPHTPEMARDAARKALMAVANGEDPIEGKRRLREALTVAQLVDRYLVDGPATKPAKRDASWANDASNLKRHLVPLMGHRVADTITKAEAARAVAEITVGKTAADVKSAKKRGRSIVRGGVGAARRTLAVTAAMFAWGVEHSLVSWNPFRNVRLSAAPVRERFLAREEASMLLDALERRERHKLISSATADAIRLLLLTGARKTEILGLRWSEVDFQQRQLLLPPERTKAGGHNGERRITLSPPALQILQRRRLAVEQGTFVFPAAKGDGHLVAIRRPFAKVCAEAKITPLRIHDLRHSFASFALADGASLFLVAKLLGHASARTAERYGHLGNDPLYDAAAAVGRRLIVVDDDKATGAEPEEEAAA